MIDYAQQRKRRVTQFTEYLLRMRERTLHEIESDCFIIFEELPDRESLSVGLSEAPEDPPAPPEPPQDDTAGKRSEYIGPLPDIPELPEDENVNIAIIGIGHPPAGSLKPSPDTESTRFVQFCFHEKWFAVDLPQTTLREGEAERLVKERPGFAREAERPNAGLSNAVQIVEFDPFFKKYIYGDEGDAAEDAAYVWFDLWRFPVDARFGVKARAFHEEKRWEWGLPIE